MVVPSKDDLDAPLNAAPLTALVGAAERKQIGRHMTT